MPPQTSMKPVAEPTSRALANLAKLFLWTAACLRVVQKRQTALTLTLLHGCTTPENSGFKQVSVPDSTVCVYCNMPPLQSTSRQQVVEFGIAGKRPAP